MIAGWQRATGFPARLSLLFLRWSMAGALCMLTTWLTVTGFSASYAAEEKSLLFDSSGRFAGTYLCTVEASGGVRWDFATEEWTGTAADQSNDETVLRVKAEHPIDVADFDGQLRTAMRYKVNISDDMPVRACSALGAGKDLVISVAGMLRCMAGTSEVHVHLGDLRFMKASWGGFWFSGDLGHRRPGMAVGTCQKL
jgi:hypothetical protein